MVVPEQAVGDTSSRSSLKGTLSPARSRVLASRCWDLLYKLAAAQGSQVRERESGGAPPGPSPSLSQGSFWARPRGGYLRRQGPSGQNLSQALSEGKHGAASNAEKGRGRDSSLNNSSCGFPTSRERHLHNCRTQARGGDPRVSSASRPGLGRGRRAQCVRRPPGAGSRRLLVSPFALPGSFVSPNVLTPIVKSDIRIS